MSHQRKILRKMVLPTGRGPLPSLLFLPLLVALSLNVKDADEDTLAPAHLHHRYGYN
jgi:hypothetical protein